jgi:hypothetical protein
MNRIACPAIGAVLLASPLFASQPSADEKEVWSLEDSYWRYVQANDLARYRTLWHADFLGWPLSSPEPVRKERITDWITGKSFRVWPHLPMRRGSSFQARNLP